MIKLNTIFVLCMLLILNFTLFSQDNSNPLTDIDAFRTLEQAKIAFEKKDFGHALFLCEKARQIHSNYITSSLDLLKKSIKPAEVSRHGDSITDIYQALKERNDQRALDVMDAVFRRYPIEKFNKSMNAFLAWYEGTESYPESDFLQGDIFAAEGEISMAFKWYSNALEQAKNFDIPETKYDLLYRMADLAYSTKQYAVAEEYYLLIASIDPLYGTPGNESTTLKAMMRTLVEEKTPEKFFLLYRHEMPVQYNAISRLAYFYFFESGKRIERSFPLAILTVISSVSLMEKALVTVDFSYKYSNFQQLVEDVQKSKKAQDYLKDFPVWDSFLHLAEMLYFIEKKETARYILSIIAEYCPDLDKKTIASKLMLLN